MSALIYLVQTLFGLYQAVLLLRLLLQMTRADFRNPMARGIVQITDPVIRPLRRLLPAAGKVDTASIVAILAVTLLKLAVIQLLLHRRRAGTQLVRARDVHRCAADGAADVLLLHPALRPAVVRGAGQLQPDSGAAGIDLRARAVADPAAHSTARWYSTSHRCGC